MSNTFKETDIKNRILYFLGDMINTKNLGLYKSKKIDKKSYESILFHYVGYMAAKNHSYITINSVNPSYLIINKINGNIEESNVNKYLMLMKKVIKLKTYWSM